MKILTYKEYYDLIPRDTALFVSFLLGYLENDEDIKMNDFVLHNNIDKILYKAICSYYNIGEEQKITLSSLGFTNEELKARLSSINDVKKADTFRKHYEIFTPFKTIDEYSFITPEDIIINIHNKITSTSGMHIFKLFSKNFSDFIKGMEKLSNDYKTEKLDTFINSFNKDLSMELIKYYEMVGKAYTYLINHIDSINSVPTGDEDIISLSFLIGYFLFDSSSNREKCPEQRLISEYFDSIGLTFDKIKKTINLDFDSDELRKIDPNLVLYTRISDLVYKMPLNLNITNVLDGLFRNTYVKSIAIQKLMFDLDIQFDKNELKNYVDNKSEIDYGSDAESITKYLLQDSKEVVIELAKLYNYLDKLFKSDGINKTIISSKNDLIDLCILISSIKHNNAYTNYLKELNIDIKSIEKALGVSIDFNHDEYVDSDITKFKDYVLSNSQTKLDVIPNSIYSNLYSFNINNSKVLDRINNNINNEHKTTNNVIEYVKTKEQNRKLELETSLLPNLDRDVYKLLGYISSYYESFNYYKVDINEDMKITLSIIYAISRYDSGINEYLHSIGISRDGISSKLNRTDFRCMNLDFNIDIINDKFKSYIFDRDNKDITIYSILDNAINKNNNFELDKLLYSLNISKKDLINVESRIEPFKEQAKQNAHRSKMVDLFLSCGSIRGVLNDTLRIHKYIKTCIESSDLYGDLIQNENDIEVLSTLFALYMNEKSSSIPYYVNNKLTFEEILEATGFTKEEFERLKELQIDEELIFNYEKYIGKEHQSVDSFARKVFDEDNNQSKIFDRLFEKTGHSYNSLSQETINKKLEDLTPEQGLVLLSKLVAPILSGDSIVDLATFGDDLNKHSSLINDQLHQLILSNSVEHSAEDINELCSGVVITTNTRKSILDLFRKKSPIISDNQEDKANIISSLRDKLDDNSDVLNRELQGYEFIKKYMEILLSKYCEYLEILEAYRDRLDEKGLTLDPNKDFNEYLNYTSMKKIIENKISTFKTSITLLQQELIKVHNAIVTHFVAINSLSTSKDAILPLIASELALNIGTKSEAKALGISKDLFNLLQSVVNQNVIETQDNLNKILSVSELDTTALNYMNQSITSYINMINASYELPEKEDVKKKELKNE